MNMKKIGFLSYPLDKMKPEKDTTYFLMLGALKAGHHVFLIDELSLESIDSEVFGDCISIGEKNDALTKTGETNKLSLGQMDEIWVRTDPPFDRSYFYNTLLLDYLPKNVKVVNKPSVLRDWNEKLSLGFFKEYGPLTMISSNMSSIRKFIEKMERVTLKPIDGFGGKGISFTDKTDPQIEDKINEITKKGSHKVVIQEYIPEAKDGDKRVLIWNGEVLGAILRLHPEDSEINNLDAGGKAIKTVLTEKQKTISENLAKSMLDKGVYFSGIDFLGDTLTEINITSPTGLRELSQFEGRDFHIEIFS